MQFNATKYLLCRKYWKNCFDHGKLEALVYIHGKLEVLIKSPVSLDFRTHVHHPKCRIFCFAILNFLLGSEFKYLSILDPVRYFWRILNEKISYCYTCGAPDQTLFNFMN